MHRRLVYIYLLNVPSFSSRYFNKIKRTSRLGRLLALSLEILFTEYYHIKLNRFSNSETWQQIFCLHTFSLPRSTLGVGLKVKIQLIENMVMLHMKLNKITKAPTCKYFGRKSLLPAPLTLWSKSTCSEHGCVAYQIKGNHKCSSVVAKILPADPAPMVMLHIKIKGMGHRALCKHIFSPYTHTQL